MYSIQLGLKTAPKSLLFNCPVRPRKHCVPQLYHVTMFYVDVLGGIPLCCNAVFQPNPACRMHPLSSSLVLWSLWNINWTRSPLSPSTVPWSQWRYKRSSMWVKEGNTWSVCLFTTSPRRTKTHVLLGTTGAGVFKFRHQKVCRKFATCRPSRAVLIRRVTKWLIIDVFNPYSYTWAWQVFTVFKKILTTINNRWLSTSSHLSPGKW